MKCMLIRISVVMAIVLTGTAVRRVQANGAPEWRLATRMYGDEKARRIGDLVTVIVEEKSSASKAANSSSGKSTSGSGSLSVGHPYYTKDDGKGDGPIAQPTAWSSATMPAWNWQMAHDFKGGGETTSEEDLASTMTARVLDVLPNGSLLLEGRRVVQLQEEKVQMVLTGMVRPRDIAADNTVSSSRLADASIRYETSGPISRDQKRGLFTRMVNWINPF
ncbi:MAG TPA: flagellar biosynthesis protein FlgH [Verrucomicrobia bacterium]|nr:flagellar biosynthesis protein FlgH [Verrucomicrobiota bacterium]